MKRVAFFSLFSLIFIFSIAEADNFSFSVPTQEQMLAAIAEASIQTNVRTALLYGLLGQETAYGGNLGKTESGWNNFCASRNTEDCRNWRNYDCHPDYRNARHLDDILRGLDYTNKSQIPYSSTCALGFTQFEPNTWWQVFVSRDAKNLNPWNINDAVLMAAYYLEDLGADKNEVLGPNDVIGRKDRIALQRYYCGGNYARQECVWYAQGVEAKARRAPVSSIQSDLQNQLNNLRVRESDLRRRLNLKQIKPQPQKLSEVPQAVLPTGGPPKAQSPAVEIPESPLVITTLELLESATQSFYYEARLTASGGTPYYQWSIVSGTQSGGLPSGYSLHSSGYLSGHHESTGSYEFTARVVDDRGKSAEKTFRLSVYSKPTIPSEWEFRNIEGILGASASFKLPVNGGVPPYTWTIFENFPEDGAPPSRVWSMLGGPPDKELSLSERSALSSSFLPPGLKFDSSSGIISGVPTESTGMGFSAMVTDSRGLNDNMSFYIKIMLPSKPITNDVSADNYPVVFRRQNGELISFFKTYRWWKDCAPNETPCPALFDRAEGIYSSVSDDDGKSWLAPRLMVDDENIPISDYFAVTEDASGSLVLINRIGDVFTFTSQDGWRWTNKRQITPVGLTDIASSIIHAKDGYYYVGFNSDFYPDFQDIGADSKKSDVFVTRSKDLISWENPVQISSGSYSEAYPELFQAASTKLYLAYSSNTDKDITIAESSDGKNWNVTGHVKTDPVFGDMGLNFVEMGGRPVLLFYGGIGGTSYYSFLENGVWSKPAKFYLDASYQIDGVVLKDGSLGLVHIYYPGDYYRDIYFATGAKLKF